MCQVVSWEQGPYMRKRTWSLCGGEGFSILDTIVSVSIVIV